VEGDAVLGSRVARDSLVGTVVLEVFVGVSAIPTRWIVLDDFFAVNRVAMRTFAVHQILSPVAVVRRPLIAVAGDGDYAAISTLTNEPDA